MRGRAGRARDCDVEEGVAAELGLGRDDDSGLWTGKSHERSHSSGALAYASEDAFCPANQKASRVFSAKPKKNIEGSFEMGDFQKKIRNQQSI